MYNKRNPHGASRVHLKELLIKTKEALKKISLPESISVKLFLLQNLAILPKMDPIDFSENFLHYMLNSTGATGIFVNLNID